MGLKTGVFSLVTLFLSTHAVLAQDTTTNTTKITPVPPIKELKTEDPISSPLRNGCPKACSAVGYKSDKWINMYSHDELVGCHLPLLFDMNVASPFSEFATLQTCVEGTSEVKRYDAPLLRRDEDEITPANGCGADRATIDVHVALSKGEAGSDVAAAAELLKTYLDNVDSCGSKIMFAKSGSTVVGLYVGAEVQTASAADIVSQFGLTWCSDNQMVQVCDETNQLAQTVGLFATSVDSLEDAQAALKTWSSGKCLSTTNTSSQSATLDILTAPAPSKRSASLQLRSRILGTTTPLTPRADCRAIQVVQDDSCASLAKRCGITAANFSKFNPKANLCATLMPQQWVCCSAGTLPDTRPKPSPDGTCYIYKTQSGDSCWSIGQSYGITENNIRDFNVNTWGWAGCTGLRSDQRICLSAGKTPMPTAVDGAVCGPLKPGTGKPLSARNGWDLVGLNPCPLNACCNGKGSCGTTADFCTNTTSKGSAPGSYKAGTNGCISNCGTDIVGNTKKPASFISVGYFQGYNQDRPCLNMDASDLTSSKLKYSYTHMHFAFGSISPLFSTDLAASVRPQFEKFVALKAPWKKIISFGGWGESTNGATFQRYRDAMKPANRERFSSQVVSMLAKYRLDGVDFDWEYPGSEAGAEAPEDATNYVAFLTLVRNKLPAGKTMSVALPASYWYLKPFPVAKIAPLVDYLVYMTYDFHGQWDAGNLDMPGCPGGDCVRSHVDKADTLNSLAMLTKAGVPATKIVVGITSYGRSYRLADAKCTGPDCKFTGGPQYSEAEPGACTSEAGYLSYAEIRQIAYDAKNGKAGVTAAVSYDANSDSDIMVWSTQGEGNVNWVAYMGDTTKQRRIEWIKGLNFAGTIDWAVDLQEWFSEKPE